MPQRPNRQRLQRERTAYWAQKAIDARVHALFRQRRAGKRTDQRLRAIAACGVVVALLSLIVWGTAGQSLVWLDTLLLVSAAIGAGVTLSCMWLAARRHDRDYHRFIYDHVGGDRVFLICLHCGYELRGCEPPRKRCPECGTPTARYVADASGGRIQLPGEPFSQQKTETP
ncbi:MAG: hypothetical protein AAFY08_10175 [Planctomycetota bacterium]